MVLRCRTVTTARDQFIEAQAAGLEPFDYLVVSAVAAPFEAARLFRNGDGTWGVGMWNRPDPPLGPSQREGLAGLGLSDQGEEWRSTAPIAGREPAVALLQRVLAEVCGLGPEAAVDVKHDSSRGEYEAEQAEQELRERIGPWLQSHLGQPARVDDDGDYVVDLAQGRLYISPQCIPGRSPIVQVFAITNIAVPTTDALGAFLARVNFELVFGRFSVDVEHGSVWLTENLLGRHLADDDLWEIVVALAETVAYYDNRIARRFGGVTARVAREAREEAAQRLPEAPPKPGQGGYL